MIRSVILFATLALGLTALEGSRRTTAQSSTASDLMQIAEESLNTQYQTLISGDSDTALKGKRLGHLFRAAITDQLAFQISRRAVLMRTRQDYKGFRTKLVFQDLQITGDKAQLKATEITEFDMDPPPGGPKVTKSSDPHVFQFENTNGEWHLVSDVIVRPAPVLPKVLPTGSLLPTPNERPARGASLKHHAEVSAKSVTSPPVSYDRYAAVNYARAHALSYNADYKRFGNDCTNFVSQSLFAGGITMVYGVYTHNDVWWYTCALPGGYVCHASYTWGAAFNLHEFLGTGPGLQRASGAQAYTGAWLGDIIFADWDGPTGHHPDGRIDHVMIVTGIDTQGNQYISQHTNDRLDRPMADIRMEQSEANFYGYNIRDSY